jgi:flavin reductase (DIM6/NTAB) family NADH-FMN oxidoreductase RutF
MPYVNLEEMETAQAYGFLMCAVVPRPIALVTTLSENSMVNAAPFSSFVVLSPKPPTVGFVCGGWEGRRKDTHANIERREEFVVNVVSESMAEAVERCATPLGPNESEIDLSKLSIAPSRIVGVPRIVEAPIAFECRLSRIIEFGNGPESLIAGCVVGVHLAEGAYRNDRIDPKAWRPLGRVGGGAFCRLSEPFRVSKDAS